MHVFLYLCRCLLAHFGRCSLHNINTNYSINMTSSLQLAMAMGYRPPLSPYDTRQSLNPLRLIPPSHIALPRSPFPPHYTTITSNPSAFYTASISNPSTAALTSFHRPPPTSASTKYDSIAMATLGACRTFLVQYYVLYNDGVWCCGLLG